jgi:hypothetical protein
MCFACASVPNHTPAQCISSGSRCSKVSLQLVILHSPMHQFTRSPVHQFTRAPSAIRCIYSPIQTFSGALNSATDHMLLLFLSPLCILSPYLPHLTPSTVYTHNIIRLWFSRFFFPFLLFNFL